MVENKGDTGGQAATSQSAMMEVGMKLIQNGKKKIKVMRQNIDEEKIKLNWKN